MQDLMASAEKVGGKGLVKLCEKEGKASNYIPI